MMLCFCICRRTRIAIVKIVTNRTRTPKYCFYVKMSEKNKRIDRACRQFVVVGLEQHDQFQRTHTLGCRGTDGYISGPAHAKKESELANTCLLTTNNSPKTGQARA